MRTSQRFIPALLSLLMILGFVSLQAQNINYMRPYDQSGVNYFEDQKDGTVDFEKLTVRLGGNFTQQFQSLSHSNSGLTGLELYELQPGFNLATANLNIDVALSKGIRLNLVTYLSSRHHPESWVKGGYIQFDELPFLHSAFVDKLMENVSIRVGHMEVNYGDTHFRRTDNGNAMYNPFIGNYIIDAFNTEIGGEVYYQKDGLIAMLGMTNGEINGNITKPRTSDTDNSDKRAASIIGKLGFDKEVADNVRLRLTGSVYTTKSSAANHIYDGDRGGSRYYLVMVPPGSSAGASGIFTSGRYNPGFGDVVTSYMFNAFLKAKGFEVFGTYETGEGRGYNEVAKRNMNQIAADVIYRFGKTENIYIGGRYNTITADDVTGNEIGINRLQLGGGWFVTPNMLFKIEYVDQQYKDFPTTSLLNDGEFHGIMIEAAVGF